MARPGSEARTEAARTARERGMLTVTPDTFAALLDRIPDKAIKDRLGDRLPGHMVPRYDVWLDDIPLNRLGKVDRQALAAIPLAAP
jgi:acyl-coenzyme A synthetase/AMP-(fatty) acid ligase